jgi:hypothetical protein
MGPFSFEIAQVPIAGYPIPFGVPQAAQPGQGLRFQLSSTVGGVLQDPVGQPVQVGSGPPLVFTGTPAANQTIVVTIDVSTTSFDWSLNGVVQATSVPIATAVALAGTGLTANFAGTYVDATTYTLVTMALTFTATDPTGAVTKATPAPSGTPGVWYADLLISAQPNGGSWTATFQATSQETSQNAVGVFRFYVDSGAEGV